MTALRPSRYVAAFDKFRYALQEQRVASTMLRRAMPRTARAISRPVVSDFLAGGGTLHTSPRSAIQATLGRAYDQANQDIYESEYALLAEELKRRYDELRLRGAMRPPELSIEDGTGLFVYSLLRCLRPRVVLETGVANGHSTFLTLRAIAANGMGLLHSTDVEADCGKLLDAEERALWNFHSLRKAWVRKDFEALLSELSTVDFFFHDSEHTYAWQMKEFEAAWAKRSPAAVLLSDDVDASYAFIDFCRARAKPPVVLFDKRKLVGAVTLASRRT